MSNRANIQTNEKHLDNTFVNVEPLVSLRCPYCNGKAELKGSRKTCGMGTRAEREQSA